MQPVAVEQRTEQISSPGNHDGVFFSFLKLIFDKAMLMFGYLMDTIN